MDAAEYIGKLLLIGLAFKAEDGSWAERFQVHGRITAIRDDGFLELTKSSGDVFVFPFNPMHIETAKPGTYRELSTGEEVVDPDLWTSCTITTSRRELIPTYLLYGFGE